MWLKHTHKSSFKESIKALEADIQHANSMAAALSRDSAVIYPSLKQLEGALLESNNYKRAQGSDIFSNKGLEDKKSTHKAPERDDECGICMETSSQVVLPNCGHSMCISCYHDWYVRSQSCPFCRGSLRRVSSGDLWILMGNSDVVDTNTIAVENLRQFYLYIEKLPLIEPDLNFLSFDYMI